MAGIYTTVGHRGDDPIMKGFIEAHDQGGLVVTVLDSAAVIARIREPPIAELTCSAAPRVTPGSVGRHDLGQPRHHRPDRGACLPRMRLHERNRQRLTAEWGKISTTPDARLAAMPLRGAWINPQTG